MHTVAVIAYDGISPFHLSVPCIAFGDDLSRLGAPRYRLLVCGERTGLVPTLSGFNIEIAHDLTFLEQADTIVMPAWRDTDERAPEALLNALRVAHCRGARLVGLCLGAFVMANTGLLDGHVAATHWAWSDDFVKRFPRVELNRNALYVEGNGILTSAGTAAAIDCCLQLIRADHGAEVATRVARRLVVAPQRLGDQAQYIETPLPAGDSTDNFAATLEWAISNLQEPLELDTLASRAGMSRRNFTRRFREKTGTSFSHWILTHRLNAAQRLLETSDKSLDRIAEIAGFGSTVAFRTQFVSAFSISPGTYRKQFSRTSG